MRITITLSLIIFLIIPSHTQDKALIDSLTIVLKDEDLQGDDRIRKMEDLVYALDSRGAQADSLTQMSLRLIEESKNEVLRARVLYSRVKYLYRIRQDMDTVYSYLWEMKALADRNPKSPDIAVKYNRGLGNYHRANKQVDSALYYMHQALEVATEHKMTDYLGNIKINIGNIYSMGKQYFKGIETLLSATEDEGVSLAYVYGNIMNLNYQIYNWDGVLRYADSTLIHAEKEKSVQPLFVANMRKAYVYYEQGRHELALQQLNDFQSRTKDLYENPAKLAVVFLEKVKNLKALNREDELLVYKDSLNLLPDNYSTSGIYSNIGSVYLNRGNKDQAIYYCEKAKSAAYNSNKGASFWLIDACKCLADAYSGSDLTKAFENLNLHVNSKEEHDNEADIAQLANALNEMELNHQTEMYQLEVLNTEQAYESRIQKIILAVSFLVLLLGLLGFSFIALRKKNRIISAKNKVIEEALEVKSMLIKEIHHRVKNNLQVVASLLNLQENFEKDDTVLKAINTGKNRVQSISLLHKNLYQNEDLKSVDVRPYFEDLLDHLMHTFAIDEEKVSLDVNVGDFQLDVDTLIPLGLIINELLTNSFKYGIKHLDRPEVSLHISRIGPEVTAIVRDNGPGLPVEHIPKRSKSLGLQLIHSFARKLNASVDIDNTYGAKIELKFNTKKGLQSNLMAS